MVAAWHRRLAGLRPDVTPWRTSRDFRILFVAGTVFYLGNWVGFVTVPFQLYQLTRSNFAVGAMGLVVSVPLIVFGLYGGALADRFDRRTMLVVTGAGQVLVTAALLGNALLDRPQVWLIYLFGGLQAVASSLQRPSREAMLPRVVRHDEMAAAVTLTSVSRLVGQLGGPALGGIVVSGAGIASAYAVDLAALAIAALLPLLMAAYPAAARGQRPVPSVRAIADGIAYAVHRRDLLGTYLVDMVGMFLAMPIVLFPALATDVLGQPSLLGLLYSAEAVGALAATLSSGWTGRVRRHGRAVVLACMTWGASVGLAGLAPDIWIAILCFAVAGAADMVSALFRAVIWNQTIPDEMRGRLAGIEMLSYQLGPVGGEVRSGLVADLTTVRFTIVSGGVLCVVGVAASAAWLRDFWRYDARTDEHAVRERRLRAAA